MFRTDLEYSDYADDPAINSELHKILDEYLEKHDFLQIFKLDSKLMICDEDSAEFYIKTFVSEIETEGISKGEDISKINFRNMIEVQN